MCDKLKDALSKISTEGKSMTKQEQMNVFHAISEDMTDNSKKINERFNKIEKKIDDKFDTIDKQNIEILKIVNQNTSVITELRTKLSDDKIEEKAFAYEESKAEKKRKQEVIKENRLYLVGAIILIGLGVAFILEHSGALASIIKAWRG